jgi:hypothetical protein
VSRLWPASEAAQVDYERLRDTVVSGGGVPHDLAWARFGRRGLAGLIAWPDADPVFLAELVGAARPAWTPYTDPRTVALALTYRLVLNQADHQRSPVHQDMLIISEGRRR